jgi:hypothetical protein
MGSLLMSEIRRSGDLSHGTPGRTARPATALALHDRPSHLVQRTSTPNTRRSSADHLVYLNLRVDFSIGLTIRQAARLLPFAIPGGHGVGENAQNLSNSSSNTNFGSVRLLASSVHYCSKVSRCRRSTWYGAVFFGCRLL